MPILKLTDAHLNALRPLEEVLRRAVAHGEPDEAIEAAAKIQALLPEQRSHHRVLRAKLWAYEACLDANRLAYAESGFVGVRRLAQNTTRLYLEASSLLAVTLLRQKKTPEAKRLIRDVLNNVNNIVSPRTRHQFQKRFIERVEEECILTEIIGTADGPMDATEIESKAILLLQRNSDDEILRLIGNSLPAPALLLLTDVRKYSIEQLPAPDRLLLPSPQKAQEPKNIGKTTFAVLRRIAWKTFCKPNSPIFKLWSQRVPKVFNEGYFASAVMTALADLRIGLSILASGLAALAMKYTAEEFCALAKPKGLMIGRGEKDA